MYYKKLEIKSAKRNFAELKDSLAIEFVNISDLQKELKRILDLYKVTVSKLELSNFSSGEDKELLISNSAGKPDSILICKINPKDAEFTADYFRNLFAGLLPRIHKKRFTNVQINTAPFSFSESVIANINDYYKSIAEGLLLGNYTFDKYKSKSETLPKLSVNINAADKINLNPIINNANNLIESVCFSRDLVNEPAITLTPQEMASRIKKDLSRYGVKVTILNKAALLKKGMNSIVTVGKASTNPPLMMILEYKGGGKSAKNLALVGKGVTYDAGGLSIKSTDNMLEMKADMAGAGAVAGIIKAAAMLKLSVNLTGVIPLVENVISGNSYKPGDVIKSYSGKTIEVKDTDAEGRIILADALHYASKQKPDEIIDFATLTGAVVVALGLFTAGIFTKNDSIANGLSKSGQNVNEPVWRLPFSDEYNKELKSDIADVSNLGSRWGGAISAAKFLEHFVDKNIPYCHVDLAGPALKHKYTNYTEKYDTGFGVRLMIDYLENEINTK